MSWREDLPERREAKRRRHGGQSGYRPPAPSDSSSAAASTGSWSTADYITIGLLLLMLAATVAVLVTLTFGGVYCSPCEASR